MRRGRGADFRSKTVSRTVRQTFQNSQPLQNSGFAIYPECFRKAEAETANTQQSQDVIENSGSSTPSSAPFSASKPPLPDDLAGLVERWPLMPEHIKAAIMALAATVKT